nr:hypothetical protein [Patescibacteria group bacterium]
MDINSFFKLFLAVSLGVGFAAFAVNNSQVRSSREVLQAWDERSAPKVKLSSWMWESVVDMPEEDQISLLSQSKEQHIARIFLDIEEYITLTEKDDIEGINNLKQKLTFFIREAKSRDIEVYALAGDVSWIFEDYRYIPKKLVEFVNEFNAMSQEEKFAGIQFDIEYYNSNEYKDSKDKTKVQFSKDYLDMVKSVKELSDTPVGFAIPYWFNRDDELMKISYNDKNRTIFRHLIDILEVDQQSKTN